MNSPSMVEFLDMIKKMYDGSENSTVYRIVTLPTRYDGSMPLICGMELVYNYDDLCVKMFDLDVSGWEISGWEISGEISCEELQNIIFRDNLFKVVTIRMRRMI